MKTEKNRKRIKKEILNNLGYFKNGRDIIYINMVNNLKKVHSVKELKVINKKIIKGYQQATKDILSNKY